VTEARRCRVPDVDWIVRDVVYSSGLLESVSYSFVFACRW
jgi:hypothetical protein